jgi:hypothetical protein
MANQVLLDNVAHKNLRIITTRSARYGDNIANTSVLPSEFRRVQAEYPIVFREVASEGHFEPVAMLGLEGGENLFLEDDTWNARYVPLTMQRQPFLIGFQQHTEGGVPVKEAVIYIDMDSARVSESEGEAVFLEHGGVSPYLEHVTSVLKAINEGHKYNKGFSDALVQYELLEPFALEVELINGSKFKLMGFHTIHEEKLNALDGDALASLHSRGYLEHIYMTMASVANFSVLIQKKNERV